MKKRTITIVVSIAILLCFIGVVTGTSLAIWKEVKSKDLGIGINPELNPSLRFQIFAPLDSSGNLISFETYDGSIHGRLQYSTVTEKGYTLFYYNADSGYDFANQYAIQNLPLYVRNGSEPYDETIHGERQYRLIDKESRIVFYKSDDGSYSPYTEIPFSTPEGNFYVSGRNDSGETVYTAITKDNLVLLDRTLTDVRLFYFDTDSLVPATSEQIMAGVNLYVYDYTEYKKDTEESINAFGKIVVDNKTTNGYYLYEKIENDYVSKYPTSTDDTANVFVGNEIHSYALVGYTGLVAEVKVPSIYTDKSGKDFNVTRICSSNAYAKESFENNPIITSIIIPSTIESIADGTFANLSNLNTIYFTGTGTVRLGQYCFMACAKLENVYTGDGVTSSVRLVDKTGRVVEKNKDDIVFLGCTSLS